MVKLTMMVQFCALLIFKLAYITVQQQDNKRVFNKFKRKEQHIKSVSVIHVFSFKGNKLTLETRPSQDGIDVREELLQFHSTYYSSNLMGLCVIGRGKTLCDRF